MYSQIARAGLALAGVATLVGAPVASPPVASAEVRLSAAEVPPGGLVTSFLANQVTYCSLICPLLVQTGATAVTTTLQFPATLGVALQGGDVLKALGVAAASVTGPTNSTFAAAILADGSLVAPRAFNAFEVGVVGVLRVVPSVAGGVPGVVTALQTARRDTFEALHAPIVPNPAPIVVPHGLVEVTVVGVLNIGAAVAFPAFNEVLGATTAVPNAVAQELAATGDPVRSVAAGVRTAAESGQAAVTVVADAVHTAARDIRAELGTTVRRDATVKDQSDSAATLSADSTKPPPKVKARPETVRRDATTNPDRDGKPDTPAHSPRHLVDKVRADGQEHGADDAPKRHGSDQRDAKHRSGEADSAD